MIAEAIAGLWEATVTLAHDKWGWKASLPILLVPIAIVGLALWLLLR